MKTFFKINHNGCGNKSLPHFFLAVSQKIVVEKGFSKLVISQV